ncbi:probable G-protein coupled receptor 132 [Pristis pectinata]|uniref:probable G-protein coupled receptor 132 n=1 Tax=Pristis pectinata TaxID=685728 RepID=UPI00223DD54C|nr:probable G-protein coupled receptor 132 [Pristis pectinata]
MNLSTSTDGSCNETMCGIKFGEHGIALAVMYSITFIVSLTMNCMTLWPIIIQVKQKNVLGIYLLSLTISDLLYALTIPLWVIYYYNGHRWKFGWITCYLSGFIFYSNVYISILLLCCISVDRYLAVVYPMKSQNIRRPSTAIKLSVLIFLSVFTFHLFIIFGTIHDNSPDMANLTCFEHIPLVKPLAVANYVRFFLGFLLPLLLLIFCYQRIFKGVRKSSTLQAEQKAKVKQLSISVIIIFLMCFGPYHIILLFRTINFSLMNCTCLFERKVLLCFSVSLAFSSFNSAVDPILYVLVSDSVKKDLKKSFTAIGYKSFRKRSSSPTIFSRTTV